jgi:predicted dinucleotide-binding enzyme
VWIGVIGAGRVGGTLARKFTKAGHRVSIANSRDPRTLHALVDELGGHVHPTTVEQATQTGELVVLAVPFGAVPRLSTVELAGKVVLDTTNYLPERDGADPYLDSGRITSSELVARLLPGAYVVKVFNTMRWNHLRDYGRQSSAQLRYGMPVSADHDAAKRRVLDLVEQVGFEPVDAGGLAAGGRRQQPGGPLYDADLTGRQLRDVLHAP